MITRLLRQATLILLGLVTVILMLETFARFFPTDRLPASLRVIVQAMQLYDNEMYRRDPSFRHITGPNLNLLIEHPDFTYSVITKLNFEDAGFRGGTLGGRVWGIALGDSFTFGMGVNHDSTWVARLSHFARQEIVNLGVPGWSPPQYTRALQRYGAPLKPKVILYGIFHNDLEDVLRFESWKKGSGLSFWLENLLQQHSITFNFLRLLFSASSVGPNDIQLNELEVGFNSKTLSHSLQNEQRIFDQAWSLTAREIEQAVLDSKRLDATFVLLYFPSKEESYWELIRQKSVFLANNENAELLRINFAKFCALRRLYCLDATPTLRKKAALGEKLYFSTDGHLNGNGNREIAEAIYQYLLENKILVRD